MRDIEISDNSWNLPFHCMFYAIPFRRNPKKAKTKAEFSTLSTDGIHQKFTTHLLKKSRSIGAESVSRVEEECFVLVRSSLSRGHWEMLFPPFDARVDHI
jgi:hypothetical protein